MRKHCDRSSGKEEKWKYVYALPIGEGIDQSVHEV